MIRYDWQVDHYFEREIVDTSKVDTLADVLGQPVGDSSTSGEKAAELAHKATEFAQTAGTAAAAGAAPAPAAGAGLGNGCPIPTPPRHTALGVEEAVEGGGGGDGTAGGVDRTVEPKATAAGLAVAGLAGAGMGGVGQQRPGQRALLRLRKKCDAGAGE